MQRVNREPIARSAVQLPKVRTLLGQSLEVLSSAVLARQIDDKALTRLPADMVQMLIDHLCAKQVLDLPALDVFSGSNELTSCVYRFALRSAEMERVANSLSWRVSDAWVKRLVRFTSLEVLELGSCHAITDGPLARCLQVVTRLRVLDVDRCKRITDAGVAPIAQGVTPLLEELSVGGTAVHAIVLALAASTPRLTHLDACGLRMGDSLLRSLCGTAPALTRSRSKDTVEAVRMVRSSATASSPDLIDRGGHSSDLSAVAPQIVSAPPAPPPIVPRAGPPPPPLPPPPLPPAPLPLPLRHHMSSSFGDPAVHAPLALQRLALANASLGDGGCASLCHLSASLQVLDLSFNACVTEWTFLGCLTGLTELDLSLNAWVDDCAVALCARSMCRLERLVLEKTSVTDGGVAALSSRACSLRYVDLSRCEIVGRSESYDAFRSMCFLRTLLLPYTLVDEQLACNLPPKLERLSVSMVAGFDDSALTLLGCQRPECLTCLDVGSPAITDAALPALELLVKSGVCSLRVWHSQVSRDGAQQLMTVTGLASDESMASSDGTYIFKRPE